MILKNILKSMIRTLLATCILFVLLKLGIPRLMGGKESNLNVFIWIHLLLISFFIGFGNFFFKKKRIIRNIFVVIAMLFILASTILVPATFSVLKYRGYYTCRIKLDRLGDQFNQYRERYGKLPLVENWCDELGNVVEFQPKQEHQKYIMNFTLNSAVVGAEQPLPKDIVLIFNSDYGWNQIGNEEDVIATLLPKKNGILVLFAGGDMRFVEAKDIDSLKWNLEE